MLVMGGIFIICIDMLNKNKTTKSNGSSANTVKKVTESRKESIKKAKKAISAKEKSIPNFLIDEEEQIEQGIKELIKADSEKAINDEMISIREKIKETSKEKSEEALKININASNDNNHNKNFDYYESLKVNENISKGKVVISMSKTSLLGIIFGLFLITLISFVAGFVISLNLQQSSFLAINMKNEGQTFALDKNANQGSAQPKSEPTDYNKSVKETLNSYVDKIIPPRDTAEDGTYEKADEDKSPISKVDLIKKQASIIPNDSHAGRFTVELTVSSKGLELQKFAKKLQDKNYGAYIVRTLADDKETEYFSLRIGSFVDYDDAYKVASQIRFKYKDKFGNASVTTIRAGEERIK